MTLSMTEETRLQPTSEAELADAVAAAPGPLRIKGGGTRAIGRTAAGNTLDTSGISGVTLYDPGALTLVVKAGTPLAEVETLLTENRQRLAFEPMDHRPLLRTKGTPTVGGMVATNASGPRRIQAGGCRDCLLGVRFVDGTGRVIKNGGRVMKNVTGYDLVKLLAGSHGTLGILTEVSLKVLPAPQAGATLTFEGLGTPDAVTLLSQALTSPYEITGAAYDPQRQKAFLRIEGFAGSVTYRAGKLMELFGSFAPDLEEDPERIGAIWRGIRDVEALHDGEGDIWRISCKPGDAAAIADRLEEATLLMDWGGGLIWASLPTGTDARQALQGIGGHATLVRAGDTANTTLPAFHPEPAPVARISAGLRSRFDPRGILNPGLMA